MKYTVPCLALVFTSFVMFSLFGCSTTTTLPTTSHQYKYEKLEITNNAIKEVVKPGMSISVETKDIVMRCVVTGYEDESTLVCIDKYKEREAKVFINDIEEIRVEVKVKESEEMPEIELVTYTDEGDLFKQLLISIIHYPRIVIVPSNTKQKLIIAKSEAEKELEYFVQENYYNIAREAEAGCGEYIDALYTKFVNYINALPHLKEHYDELTKDLFCKVLQKDVGVMFAYDDLFLPTLVDRIKVALNYPSNIDRHYAFENDCEGIGDAIKIKEEESVESFTITCSDNRTIEFHCDFQGRIVYDDKGIPYKKATISYVMYGQLVKSPIVQPVCWRSEPSSIVRRLAVQHGCPLCEDVGKVTKIKKEGNIESFVITCSDGIKEFQCDFQGEIELRNNGFPVKKVYGKSYKVQPACWLL